MSLTTDQISVATGAKTEKAQEWNDYLNQAMDQFEINTPSRQAAFLAQIGVESGGLTELSEDLYYSHAERIQQIFSHHFAAGPEGVAQAQEYIKNPEKLANYVYANRNGNGDEASGDGWTYAGKGPIQLTGKANVLPCLEAIGCDDPQKLTQPQYGSLSAAWFWSQHSLNDLSDQLSGDPFVFDKITRIINGAETAEPERLALWHKAWAVIGQDTNISTITNNEDTTS